MKHTFLFALLIFTFIGKAQVNFTQINTGTNQQLLSIFMPNNSLGFVTGDHGVFKRTTNGGTNWSGAISTGTNQALWQVTGVKADTTGQHLFIAGDIPSIIRSNDSGITFLQYPTGLPAGSYLLGINAIDTSHIYVCGSNPFGGCFAKSSDGGQTWEIVTIPSSALFLKVFFADTLNGFIAGLGSTQTTGSIYQTTDGGQTWQNLQTTPYPLTNITGINKDTCVAVGLHGQILLTTDNGNNWQDKSVDTSDLWGLTVFSVHEFYATGGDLGDSSFVYHSSDAGQNWNKAYTGYNSRTTGISIAPASSRIYCSAQSGIILRSSLSSSVYNISAEKAAMIYPNPANDLIYLPNNTEHAEYTMLNITGASVQAGTIKNGRIQVENLMPGIYILVVKPAFERKQFLKFTKN